MIISIDCGTKNFSWCALDGGAKIVGWDVCPLKSSNGPEFLQSVESCPDFIQILTQAEQVIIEQQPPRNYGMLRQMFYLECFCAKYAPTCVVHAQTKVATWKKHHPNYTAPRTYTARKQRSIETVAHMLDTGILTVELDHNPFHDSKKRDDLSDCVCQAMSYLDRSLGC